MTQNRIETPETATFAKLVAELAGGVRELFAAHAQQWRAEVRHETQQARNAGVRLAIGSVLSSVGAVFVLLAIVMGLKELLLWPDWAAWFAVGSIAAVGGAALATIGWQRFLHVHWIPDRTLHSMQESLSCLTNGKK